MLFLLLYGKKIKFDKKKNGFFFYFSLGEDTNSKLCMKSDKMWHQQKEEKRNETFVKPKSGIKLNSWEDAASPFNLFGILYLWS